VRSGTSCGQLGRHDAERDLSTPCTQTILTLLWATGAIHRMSTGLCLRASPTASGPGAAIHNAGANDTAPAEAAQRERGKCCDPGAGGPLGMAVGDPPGARPPPIRPWMSNSQGAHQFRSSRDGLQPWRFTGGAPPLPCASASAARPTPGGAVTAGTCSNQDVGGACPACAAARPPDACGRQPSPFQHRLRTAASSPHAHARAVRTHPPAPTSATLRSDTPVMTKPSPLLRSKKQRRDARPDELDAHGGTPGEACAGNCLPQPRVDHRLALRRRRRRRRRRFERRRQRKDVDEDRAPGRRPRPTR
jgi:hypothetical protein